MIDTERMNDSDIVTRLCSVRDAAQLLGIPVPTAQRWARAGRLPVVTKMTGGTGAYVLDLDAVRDLAAERGR